MFQRIFVPLDGSRRAEDAIPVAARIARASSGIIVLFRAVPSLIDSAWYLLEPSGRMGYAPVWYPVDPSGRPGYTIDTEVARAKEYLAMAARSDDLAGVEMVTEVVPGDPAHTVLSVAHAQDADLIVMCSRGETGLKRWLSGSVAQKVARHSSIPVLVLREGVERLGDARSAGKRVVRILVPLDESPSAEVALSPAAQLSVALSAPMHGALHLARILPLPVVEDKEKGEIARSVRAFALTEATRYLHAAEQQLQTGDAINGIPPNMEVTSSVDIDTDIAGRLIGIAENGERREDGSTVEKCDIIAMATHGRGGVGRWLVGSTAERILSSTRLPLLILRPQKAVAKSPSSHLDSTLTR